ncbi:MAG: pseudouridine synthase [Verrucomicrobiota bacterium]|nr:pseudouridine synthase [Verrucomicrobiota bacterium]
MENLIIFEDEDLLAINKPAGLNTHSPGPFAGMGIYEWLKNRQPRWARLAVLHRLDKETSGLLLFGKSTLANRSLTQQFSEGTVQKKYFFLTDRSVTFKNLKIESALVRAGEKYVNRPLHVGSERAETHFKKLADRESEENPGFRIQSPKLETIQNSKLRTQNFLVEARPLTGKTHQIRVHAAANGFPILGDAVYGGTAAARIYLHAAELIFKHPSSGQELKLIAPTDFACDPRLALRAAVIDFNLTNTFRLIDGAADGWPGWHLDKLGDFLLSESWEPPGDDQKSFSMDAMGKFAARGVYHKTLNRHVQNTTREKSPQFICGEIAPEEFLVREYGVKFALRFSEGYSVGLFLDQRENRCRLLTNYIGPDFFISDISSLGSLEENLCPLQGLTVLNTFAYTCGFSVCAARAGAKVTSLDLSKKYLNWGKQNFALNHLEMSNHEFICGDVFDWLRRWAKKKRVFDVVILDPPTFSHSKKSGCFQAEKNYGKLIKAALPILKPNGILFASNNTASFAPENFLAIIKTEITAARRKIVREQYVPQPPDFPISREGPAYLKTVWLQINNDDSH